MGKFTTRKKRKRKRKTEMQILCTLLSVSGREIRVRWFILKVKKEMKKKMKGKKRRRKKRNHFRNRKWQKEYVYVLN